MPQVIPPYLLCDDLFLLIGTNTLPNWIAAQLLVKPKGTAHLAYTSGVRKHAERLKRILEEEQKSKPETERMKVEWFETAEADAQKIFDDVRRRAEVLKRGNKVIGLNYTGGTKMMSVHAHRAMNDLGFTASLSYLDARSLRMKFDSDGGDYDISLDDRTRIGIAKLLRLHDNYPHPDNISFRTSAKGVAAAAGLIEVHAEYSGQHIWRDWCDALAVKNVNPGKLRRYNPRKYESTVKRLNQVRLLTEVDFNGKVEAHLNKLTREKDSEKRINPADASRFLRKIVDGYRKMLAGLGASGGASLQTVAAANPDKFADSMDLAKWLDGYWLEHYAFDQLRSVARDCDVNQDGLAINLETANDERRTFEADVIALRGYQLYYISCYTGSENNRSKQKLFEALERAGQLGGDEAKVGLVCNSDSPAKLRKECEADWERLIGNQIEVFGREDLPVLANEFKKWFNGERRKGR